ncbi:hypothetical protein GCM10010269_16320 [Streptomyces humidus]|uniref:Uncharacterized protein n=1 Tax=Streptomyces humidus TaxID=52259 RepID=A0A918L1X3_9ACTN|nr:hypothetical protein GCM10010269_16320 [Streptomyces humidus]
MEHVCALVVTRGNGSGLLEPIDRPLDFVAALVHLLVEADGSASPAAAPPAGGTLVPRLGDDVLDLASTQVAVIVARAVRPITTQVVGPRARVPSAGALDPDTLQDGDHLRAVAPLAGGDQQGQRPATALPGEVDLA